MWQRARMLPIVRSMTGPSPDRLALAAAEDQHTAADWEKITAGVLRKTGRLTESDPDNAVWTKLARTTLDGISVAPIGTSSDLDGLATAGRPTRQGDWDIRAQFDGPDAKAVNASALMDLANGVNSLWLQIGSGLAPADLETVLAGVLLDIAPITLDAGTDAVAAATALAALLPENANAATNLGADPFGTQVRGGTGSLDDLVTVAKLAQEKNVLGVVVDGTAVHDLGASDGQELGYSLAVGAAYLRALTEAGLTVEQAAGLIEFRYAATGEQFPTIAKFRAARRLWVRVLELSGLTGGSQLQHAVTSRPMMTKYDPWVNMLRVTVGAFAAGVGGAESVTVLPFDSTAGIPDALGRRIARNTSSLLISEAHVAKVVDPAGGSYAVEKLTDDIAKVAWAEFGRIEEVGGIAAALADGSLKARIDEVVAVRETQIAKRKRPITGISEFPNLGETLPERAASAASDTVRRYGASFEALRDEPVASPVFLATMGPVAAHTARATFATNLFAAGGISVDVAGATADVDELLKAYAGQKVVCLAGTDAVYAEWAPAAIEALRAAGATYVILAGKPGDLAVDASAAMGLDALAFLNKTREALA